MAYHLAYTDETGPVYIDDITGQISRDGNNPLTQVNESTGVSVPVLVMQPYTGATRFDSDGRPIDYVNWNNASDFTNVKFAYKETHDLNDAAAAHYLSNAGVFGIQMMLGDHLTSKNPAYPLTPILDNKKQWFDYVAPLVIGAVAGAAGAGLLGTDALANVGAGATEFGGETAIQGASYIETGTQAAQTIVTTSLDSTIPTLPDNTVSQIDSMIEKIQSGANLPSDTVSKIDSIIDQVNSGKISLPPDVISKVDSIIDAVNSGATNLPPSIPTDLITKFAGAAGTAALTALTHTAQQTGIIPAGYRYNPTTGLLQSTGSGSSLFGSGGGGGSTNNLVPIALGLGLLMLLSKNKRG